MEENKYMEFLNAMKDLRLFDENIYLKACMILSDHEYLQSFIDKAEENLPFHNGREAMLLAFGAMPDAKTDLFGSLIPCQGQRLA